MRHNVIDCFTTSTASSSSDPFSVADTECGFLYNCVLRFAIRLLRHLGQYCFLYCFGWNDYIFVKVVGVLRVVRKWSMCVIGLTRH